MMRKIVFATNNKHKLQEVSPLLEGKCVLQSLSDIGCADEIPETADTLQGNALQKAMFVYEKYGLDCFSDDTGLEVEILNGAPGVYSARYANLPPTPSKRGGEAMCKLSINSGSLCINTNKAEAEAALSPSPCGEGRQSEAEANRIVAEEVLGEVAANNIKKLLSEMEGATNRNAKFRTVIALIFAGETYFFEGEIKGTIITKPVGMGGFGYNPIFIPEGYDKTFAEMDLNTKNTISHRARAVEKLISFLTENL